MKQSLVNIYCELCSGTYEVMNYNGDILNEKFNPRIRSTFLENPDSIEYYNKSELQHLHPDNINPAYINHVFVLLEGKLYVGDFINTIIAPAQIKVRNKLPEGSEGFFYGPFYGKINGELRLASAKDITEDSLRILPEDIVKSTGYDSGNPVNDFYFDKNIKDIRKIRGYAKGKYIPAQQGLTSSDEVEIIVIDKVNPVEDYDKQGLIEKYHENIAPKVIRKAIVIVDKEVYVADFKDTVIAPADKTNLKNADYGFTEENFEGDFYGTVDGKWRRAGPGDYSPGIFKYLPGGLRKGKGIYPGDIKAFRKDDPEDTDSFGFGTGGGGFAGFGCMKLLWQLLLLMLLLIIIIALIDDGCNTKKHKPVKTPCDTVYLHDTVVRLDTLYRTDTVFVNDEGKDTTDNRINVIDDEVFLYVYDSGKEIDQDIVNIYFNKRLILENCELFKELKGPYRFKIRKGYNNLTIRINSIGSVSPCTLGLKIFDKNNNVIYEQTANINDFDPYILEINY